MATEILLYVTQGILKGSKYSFTDRFSCIMGRAEDCGLVINKDADAKVSRYHCVLDINPPNLRIQDLNSRNGTFVNGVDIRPQKKTPTTDETQRESVERCELSDGDEFRIGDTSFRVRIREIEE